MDIEFEDRNVTEDPAAMAELQDLGYFSTPVTFVDDAVVIGFDREKLSVLLNID
jgi:hypothetical protein